MLSLIPALWQRREFIFSPCITLAFFGLAVMVQINLQGSVIRPLVLGTMLLGCLLLLGCVNAHRWMSLGTPGILVLATMASYLVIGTAVLLFTDITLLQPRDVLRQAFFLLVTLAAILGGRALLERIGIEMLLQRMLAILMASCAVVLASPLLRDLGVLPPYRVARATGTFTDPNDAGFIACMTAVLALVLLYRGQPRRLAYAALVLGYAAAFASVSFTALVVLEVLLTLSLLVNMRCLQQDPLRTGLSVLGIVGIVWFFFTLLRPSPTPLLPAPDALPKVQTGVAMVRDLQEVTRVGDTIVVYMAEDREHRIDDNPVPSWQWQRTRARRGDAYMPNDTAWTDIDNHHPTSFSYIPTADDQGQFLRASISYEKAGVTYRVQTVAIGPILASVNGTALSEESAVPFTDTVGSLRGEIRSNESGDSSLSQRLGLWEMGFVKIRESPIVGHGLYQLHFMEGAPLNYHNRPNGVHNLYLMLLGEAGIVPLACFVLALFFLGRLIWTMPVSLIRDVIVGWTVVMVLFGMTFQHLLTMGAYNFLIGLSCAMAAFLVEGRTNTALAG